MPVAGGEVQRPEVSTLLSVFHISYFITGSIDVYLIFKDGFTLKNFPFPDFLYNWYLLNVRSCPGELCLVSQSSFSLKQNKIKKP